MGTVKLLKNANRSMPNHFSWIDRPTTRIRFKYLNACSVVHCILTLNGIEKRTGVNIAQNTNPVENVFGVYRVSHKKYDKINLTL